MKFYYFVAIAQIIGTAYYRYNIDTYTNSERFSICMLLFLVGLVSLGLSVFVYNTIDEYSDSFWNAVKLTGSIEAVERWNEKQGNKNIPFMLLSIVLLIYGFFFPLFA